jgi:hypothetical protein
VTRPKTQRLETPFQAWQRLTVFFALVACIVGLFVFGCHALFTLALVRGVAAIVISLVSAASLIYLIVLESEGRA